MLILSLLPMDLYFIDLAERFVYYAEIVVS